MEGNLIVGAFNMIRLCPMLFIWGLFSGYFVTLFVPLTIAKQQVYYRQV